MNYEQAFHDGAVTGAAEERRAIVRWLRDVAGTYQAMNMAACIERGDHVESAPCMGAPEETP